MKRLVLLTALLVALVWPTVSTASSRIAVGVSGGLNIPLLQDDQGTGETFEIRARLGVTPFLALEPHFAMLNFGSPDVDGFDYNVDGAKLTLFGVDGALGYVPGQMGLNPFFTAGFGMYKLSNDELGEFEDSDSKFGWSAGLGLGVGFSPNLSFEARGKFHLVPIEGDFSRKALTLTGGLSYSF